MKVKTHQTAAGVKDGKVSAASGHAGSSNPAEAFVVSDSQNCKAKFATDEVPDGLHLQWYHDASSVLILPVVSCPFVLRY